LHQRYDNSVVLRVPAAKLELVIAEITEWGVVEWKTLEALDVTAEYTDLDSRIRVLEQMQKHLKELLERAKDVEQSLEIQVELARITAELEQLRAQMRMLESSIAFSTLAVQLSERSTVQAEPSDDPFPWVDELGAEATAYR
jgi:chromosome segregation ATPase